MCECAGGAGMCHASNVRKLRSVKSALRKQANLRKAKAAKSRGASAKSRGASARAASAAAPGFASARFPDAHKPASALSFREQIQLFDAKHNRDENAREQRREPDSVFPEAPIAALRGSASRESDSESDDDGIAPADSPAPHGAGLTMTITEEKMFLDVLMMNERLVEENDWLRKRHESASLEATLSGNFAGEGDNADVLAEHVSHRAEPQSYETSKMELLDGFATHPEMGVAALRVHAVALMETPGAGATRKRPSPFDAAADGASFAPTEIVDGTSVAFTSVEMRRSVDDAIVASFGEEDTFANVSNQLPPSREPSGGKLAMRDSGTTSGATTTMGSPIRENAENAEAADSYDESEDAVGSLGGDSDPVFRRVDFARMSFVGYYKDEQGKALSKPRIYSSSGESHGVSRSIGDRGSARACVATPEIRTVVVPFGSGARFMACSDGVWDAFSSDKATRRVSRFVSPQGAAKRMCVYARERMEYRGMHADDITAVVVDVGANARGGEPQCACVVS